MKTVIMRIQKSSRLTVMLVAAVVAIVTSAVVAETEETLFTRMKSVILYSLPPNGITPAIMLAPFRPVLVMGCCTTHNFRGVGHVTLLHIPSSFIEWVGLESPSHASITQGFSSAVGTHIVYIDFAHQVDIEVNSADTIRVHNGAAAMRTGNVTLIW